MWALSYAHFTSKCFYFPRRFIVKNLSLNALPSQLNISNVKDSAVHSSRCFPFLRFPSSNPGLLDQWVVAAGRDNFKPTRNHFLCSKHFKEDDFLQGYNRRQLKHNAVPSIFGFSKKCTRVRQFIIF